MDLKERVLQGQVPIYAIEEHTKDAEDAVRLRREVIGEKSAFNMDAIGETIPPAGFYEIARGACCENVIGTLSIPMGVVGPLLVDDQEAWIPMATCEGALVASVSRGCKVLTKSNGVKTVITKRGMSRGVVFETEDLRASYEAKLWIENNFDQLAPIFQGDSRHCRLESVRVWMAGGSLLYVRFTAHCGEAMGMNMVTKGAEQASRYISQELPFVRLLSLSGNMCIDKKASMLNWLEGRGHSVIAEAHIPANLLKSILHVTPAEIVKVAQAKNLIGSAMAGAAPHGCNAHAANIIAAMFLACGQDAAQIVESSACLTLVDLSKDGIVISCTIPSLEIGTVGGGTRLPGQANAIKLICGGKVERMASVMAATVIAGELSLLASLTEGSLMRAHLSLNRK